MAIDEPHEAIRDVLLNDAAVAGVTTTIVPWQLWRRDERPAITYQRISTQTLGYTYSGAVETYQERTQWTVWADRYDTAHDAVKAMQAALDGHQDVQKGEIKLHRVRVDDIADQPEPPEAGQETSIYAVRLETITHYDRS